MTQSILVADDEPSILLSLQFLLQKAGYEVRLARNGEEVIQAVEQSTPDLLLLDAMMPQRDGYDVCQTIRAPICALSPSSAGPTTSMLFPGTLLTMTPGSRTSLAE